MQTDPQVWGPPLWDLLFTFAFQAPTSHLGAIIDLFACLEYVLPCEECRKSYATYRKQTLPLTSLRTSKVTAPQWLWTMHDMVNQKLDKPSFPYERVVFKHQHMKCLAHPLSALGLLRLMAAAPSLSYVHLARFARCLLRLCAVCPGMKDLADAFGEDRVNERNLDALLQRANNALRTKYNLLPLLDTEVPRTSNGKV
jgi:hypothetical protein